MENRGAKTKTETDLRQRLQANTEAIEFATRQLTELSAGSSRVERDAVIVVHKTRPQATTVRLGYLVGSANWWPQYRLRSANGADNAPVRLEYLAALTQQTGESWSNVSVTLSTARPSLDAAPPELLPLKMAIAGHVNTGPIDGQDDRSQRIFAELAKPLSMSFANETSLDDILKYVKKSTASPTYPDGIPIYVDPIGLQEAEKSLTSTVTIDLQQVPLRTSLSLLLNQLGLAYQVKDGLLKIISEVSANQELASDEPIPGGMGGMGGGMGLSLEQSQAVQGGGSIKRLPLIRPKSCTVADGQVQDTSPARRTAPASRSRSPGGLTSLATRSAVARGRPRATWRRITTPKPCPCSRLASIASPN